MSLLAHVLLSAGSALISVGIGRMIGAPPIVHAVVMTLAMIFAMRLAREHAPVVLIPFAGAGALIGVGGVAAVFGAVAAMMALIGFMNAKAEKAIPSWAALLGWGFAAAVASAGPYVAAGHLPEVGLLSIGWATVSLGIGAIVYPATRKSPG